MRWPRIFVFASWILCFFTSSALANGAEATGTSPADEQIVKDYMTIDNVFAESNIQTSTLYCPASGIVAFSVGGSSHVSQGNLTLLGYSDTYTNTGPTWTPGGGTFVAPCRGLYFFSV